MYIVDSDHPSLEAAFAAVEAGDTLEIRRQYSRDSPFVVNKPCEIRFRGGQLTQTTATPGMSIQADDVVVDRPRIVGTGADSYGSASGIVCEGTTSTPRECITLIRPDIAGFNKAGIDFGFVHDITIEQPRIRQVTYAGIMLRSCEDGRVKGGSISGVTMSGITNSYGVTATRSNGDLSTHPRSKNITFEGMCIDGVRWEGMDTHGGENIRFIENTITACQTGIAMVASSGASGGSVYGPQGVIARGNTINSAGCPVPVRKGIEIQGVGADTSSPELATGWILANRITGYGADNDSWSDASIKLWNTGGVLAADNYIASPAGCAIALTGQNYAFSIARNTAVDMWRTAGASPRPCFLVLPLGTAVGTISANRVTRGSKDATGLVINTHGVLLAAGAQNDITITSDNDFSACRTLQVQDVSTVTKAATVAKKVGFYGAAPVPQQALPASPTTAQIKDVLAALGLIA